MYYTKKCNSENYEKPPVCKGLKEIKPNIGRQCLFPLWHSVEKQQLGTLRQHAGEHEPGLIINSLHLTISRTGDPRGGGGGGRWRRVLGETCTTMEDKT